MSSSIVVLVRMDDGGEVEGAGADTGADARAQLQGGRKLYAMLQCNSLILYILVPYSHVPSKTQQNIHSHAPLHVTMAHPHERQLDIQNLPPYHTGT